MQQPPNKTNDESDKKQCNAIEGSLASYDVSALMAQTRKLASDYRRQTGQALPVTEELARFDAINLFQLTKLDSEVGVDATNSAVDGATDVATDTSLDGALAATTEEANSSLRQDHQQDYYLIKGRVIFKGGKARQKLGKLSLTANWTVLLMVIYDPDYMPVQIYSVKREVIEKELNQLPQNKRGSMTIAKYKAIGDLVWDNSEQS